VRDQFVDEMLSERWKETATVPRDQYPAADRADIGQSITLLLAIDEFDRLTDRTVPALVADTIKSLSDAAVPATLILIGVADSVDQLIEGHRSIERSLVQVPMPRMSRKEIEQIVVKGTQRLGMSITKEALGEIVRLSQGLPYVTHMLSLYSASNVLLGALSVHAGFC
jgi:hypothetical protein